MPPVTSCSVLMMVLQHRTAAAQIHGEPLASAAAGAERAGASRLIRNPEPVVGRSERCLCAKLVFLVSTPLPRIAC